MDGKVDVGMNAAHLAGWVPARIDWQEASPAIDWCYLGARRLAEPFFEQSIQACIRQPFNLLFRHRTPIEALAELREVQPGLQPSGFIFHMSRCGSTLVSQMLAALPRTVVVSEAGPLDSVLRAHLRVPGLSDERQLDWLRWMVSALGQPRRGDDERLFIKFDCWDTLALPLVRRAFPGVPWIFIYRNPIEVMVSQLKRRGAHLVPGVIEPALFGLDAESIRRMQPEEYCARVLAQICDAALRHHQGGGMLLNYRQLPQAVWASVLNFFGVEHTEAEVEALGRVARFDAKNPSLHFSDDTETKNYSATDLARRQADDWVVPVYERLEAARRGR
jgi:hypothetical protein